MKNNMKEELQYQREERIMQRVQFFLGFTACALFVIAICLGITITG